MLTVQTTDGEDFFTFVQRHFMHWKLGQKNKNNGAFSRSRCRRASRPHPHRERSGRGHARLVVRIVIAGDRRNLFRQGQVRRGFVCLDLGGREQSGRRRGVKLDGMPGPGRDENNNSAVCAIIFLLFIVILLVAAFINSRPKNRRALQNWGPTYGGGFGGRILG